MNNPQQPNFGQNDTPFGTKQKIHEVKNPKKVPIFPMLLGVIVILALLFANSFIYIVAEDELAVIKIFNETKKVIVDPDNDMAKEINDLDPQFKDVEIVRKKGLFFKIPFITEVEKPTSKLITYVSNTGKVTTSDKVKFEVQLFAQWEITHPGLFETNYGTIQKTTSKIDETLYADIIGLINKLDSDEFLTDKEALYSALIAKKDEYNSQNLKTGILIQDLEIYRVAIPASNYTSVYNKMNAERNAVAATFIADGQKLYAETISDVDLLAAEIEAAAIETSAQIKGEADAEAIQIYADAFSIDPDFYEFWRTIQAYENAIDENTTIYLDKSNSFLKFFSNFSTESLETE